MVNFSALTQEQLEDIRFSQEELEEIENMRGMDITFDEDCPEVTPELAMKYHRVNPRQAKQA